MNHPATILNYNSKLILSSNKLKVELFYIIQIPTNG